MIGILIFFVVLALVLFLLRYVGDKSYDKFYPNVIIPSKQRELVEQNDNLVAQKDNIVQQSISDELIAVITAAAHSVIAGSIIIKKINFIEEDSNDAWKNIGRLTNLSSHMIQEKK